jgi:hypothetical protein
MPSNHKNPRVPTGIDRPIRLIVALDPAYTGPCGVCALPLGGDLAPDYSGAYHWQGVMLREASFRGIADAVAERLNPGERALFVTESDAFGPSVARKLGMSTGALEGLLIDIGAMQEGTRLDVSQATWRRGILPRPIPVGRTKLKRAAMKYAAELYQRELRADEAEAALIAAYIARVLPGLDLGGDWGKP